MANTAVFVQPSLTVDGETYRVLAYSLRESLCEAGFLTCEVVKDNEALPAPKDVVDKPAELTLERSDGTQKRSFIGTVVEAARSHAEDDVQTLALRIVPKLWRLAKRADCRTFQKKTAVDIAKAVLEGAGVPADQQEWKVTGSPQARDYCVQYRETDLDFLLRLLSEEGIWFTVVPRDGKDVVVCSDDPAGLGTIEGTSTLPYLPEHGFRGATDHVHHLEMVAQVQPDKVFVRDYNPDKPKLKIEAAAEGTDAGAHALEVYAYPGRFADASVAKHYAQVLVESLQARRETVSGETGVLSMEPGYCFTLDAHPAAALNQEYLVTEVRLSGRAARHGARAGGGMRDESWSYACRFTAVPKAKTKVRPPRRAAARTVPGVQTAITTGPSGEEIHTDAGGHVKAQFHWDRLGKKDENSSCWMRTSQLPTGGSMLLPRMGWEVSVRFNEGDADRPVVMGRMYNGTTPPPYELPKHKVRSALQTATTPGGGSTNEFRMDSTKGKEEFFFNASKDMSIDVNNNATESVGNNSTRTIGSNQKVNVTNSVTRSVAADQTVKVGGNQSLKVQTAMVDQVGGSHTLKIGGNRTMMIGGDHRRTVTADSTHTVGGNQIDLVVGSVTDETMASFTHKVGAALVEFTAGSHSVMVGGSMTETAGAAKIIAARGGRGVEVGGTLMHKVAGAIIHVASGAHNESAGGTYTEIATGASVVKATNIVIEGETMVSLVMGASTITLMPSMIAVAGVSIKLDGATADLGAMVVDN